MSEWKQGGHQDWLARQETLACARELAGDASELSEAAEGSLADHLSVVLSARYAPLVSGWNGEMDDEFRWKVRALRTLCQDIVELRRGDHCAERLRLDLDRLAEASKADEVRSLEAVIEEVNQWPDVRQAFNDAFALLRQWKTGGTAEGGSGAEIQPDLTESNQLSEWKQRWAARPLLDFRQFEHSRLNGTPRHGRVRPHSERRSGGVTCGCKWVQ